MAENEYHCPHHSIIFKNVYERSNPNCYLSKMNSEFSTSNILSRILFSAYSFFDAVRLIIL